MNLKDVFECLSSDSQKIDAAKKFVTKNARAFSHSEVLSLFDEMAADTFRKDLLSLIAPRIPDIYGLLVTIFTKMASDTFRIEVAKIIKRYMPSNYTMSCNFLADLFRQFASDTYRKDLASILRCVTGVTCEGAATILNTMSSDTYKMDVLKLLPIPSDLDNAELITATFASYSYVTQATSFLGVFPPTPKKYKKTVSSRNSSSDDIVYDGGNITIDGVSIGSVSIGGRNIFLGNQIQTLNGMTTGTINNGERVTQVHVLDIHNRIKIGQRNFGGGSLKYNGCNFDTIQREGQRVFRFTDVEGKYCLLSGDSYTIQDGILYDDSFKRVEMVDPFATSKKDQKSNWITKEDYETFIALEISMANKQEEPPIPKEKECSICQERVANHVYIPCGHFNCIVCAYAMQQATKKCPTCRKDIEGIVHAFI